MARPGQFLLLLLVAAFVAHAHGRRNHGRYYGRHHDPNDYHRPRGHHHHHQSSSTVPSTTPSTTYFPVYDGTANYPLTQYKDETDVPKADQVPNVNAEAETSDKLDNGNNIHINALTVEDKSNDDNNKNGPVDVNEVNNSITDQSIGVDNNNPDSGNPDRGYLDSGNPSSGNSINIDEITPINKDLNNEMDVGNGNLPNNPNGGDKTFNDNGLTSNSIDIGSITTPGTIFINGSTPPPDPPRHNINKLSCIINENGRCEDEKPNINKGGLSSGGGATHQDPDIGEGGDLGGDVASNLPDEIIPSENGKLTEKPKEHGHHNNKNKTVVLPVYLPGLGSHVMYPGGPVVAQNDKIPAFYVVLINGQATLVKNPAAVVGGTGNNINQGSVVLGDSNISLGDLTGINSGSFQLPWINVGTGGSNVGGNIGVLPQQPIWIGSQYPNIGGLNIGGGFPGAAIITEPLAVPVPEPVPTGSFIYPNIGYGNAYWPSMWPGMNTQLPNVNVNLTNPWYTNPAQNVNWPSILNFLLNLLSQVPNVQPPNPVPGVTETNPTPNHPGGSNNLTPTPRPFVPIPNFKPDNPEGNNYATPTPSPFVTIPSDPEKIPGGNNFKPGGPDINPELNDYVTPTQSPFVTIPNIPEKIPNGNHFKPGGPDNNPVEDDYVTPSPSKFVTIPSVPEKIPGGNHFNPGDPDSKPVKNDNDIPTPSPFETNPNIPEKKPGGNHFIPGGPDRDSDENNHVTPTRSPFVTIPYVPEKIPGGNHFNPGGSDGNLEEKDHVTPTPSPFVTIPYVPEKIPGGNHFNPGGSDGNLEEKDHVTPTPSPFVTIPYVPEKIPGGNHFNPGGSDGNPKEKDHVTPTPSPFVTIPNVPEKIPGGNHVNSNGPDGNSGRNDNYATPTPRPFVTIPDILDKKPGGTNINPGRPDADVSLNGRATPGPDVMRTPDYDNDMTSRSTPTFTELVIPLTTPKPGLNHPKLNHPRPGPHEHDPAIINLLNILLKIPPTTSGSNSRVPKPNTKPSPHQHPKDNDQLTKLLLEVLKKEGGNTGNKVHKEKVPPHPKPNVHPNSDNLAHLLAQLLEGHNQPNLNILLEPGMDESRSNLMLIQSLLASQMGSNFAPGMNYYQQYPPLRSENPLLYFLGHFPCEQSANYGSGQSGIQRGLWQLLSNMYGMNSIRFDRSAEETDDEKAPESQSSPVNVDKK